MGLDTDPKGVQSMDAKATNSDKILKPPRLHNVDADGINQPQVGESTHATIVQTPANIPLQTDNLAAKLRETTDNNSGSQIPVLVLSDSREAKPSLQMSAVETTQPNHEVINKDVVVEPSNAACIATHDSTALPTLIATDEVIKPAQEVNSDTDDKSAGQRPVHVPHSDGNNTLDSKCTAIGRQIRPESIYKKYQKLLKKRIFPCPTCGDPADGSHQCVVCFAHVHVICGTPFEDSCEGFGQLVCCKHCEAAKLVKNTPHVVTSEQARSQCQTRDRDPLHQTPPRPPTDPNSHIRPAGLYTQHHTIWREREFPCPACGDPANEAHQCVRCFAHIHETCGTICEGSSEGLVNNLYYGGCEETHE